MTYKNNLLLCFHGELNNHYYGKKNPLPPHSPHGHHLLLKVPNTEVPFRKPFQYSVPLIISTRNPF